MRDAVDLRDAFSDFLGLRWDEPDVVRMEITPRAINSGGLLTGPVAFALVDYGMTAALMRRTAEDERIATLNVAINYVQTATEGEITCRTRLDHRGRGVAVLSSELRHADGRLLATAIGTFAVRRAAVTELSRGRS